jgi:hypothetical protein
VKVVEVSSHLSGGPIIGRDLPTLQFGHLLGECGSLDALCYLKLLLYALALAYLLL